ncbi:MAG: class I tRNA ligase family protein, partial [Pseudomonadota bacterium]
SDQHRGWFQSSLLEGIATRGKSPFKTVVTHGFVVDGEGKKMSKSLGNFVNAQDVVKEKGAEMLRLWTAMEDYRNDIRMSNEIMDRVVESYRRIRNTARFCLGNLSDFKPDENSVPANRLAREMDVWAMGSLSRLIERAVKAYDDYEFHMVVSAVNEFCVVDLSSLYLDVGKDILYCDEAAGPLRRSVQTVLFEAVRAMAQLLAPILPFTAEEIWDHLPQFKGKAASIHLSEFPTPLMKADADLTARWKKLLRVRGEVSKALEALRKEKKIGQALEAEVEVVAPEEFKKLLKSVEAELPKLWIVSRARIVDALSSPTRSFPSIEIPGLEVGVAVIEGPRCDRCWNYTEDVGKDASQPGLCVRCAKVVGR